MMKSNAPAVEPESLMRSAPRVGGAERFSVKCAATLVTAESVTKMKKVIHINQHKIRAKEPKVITVKTYKDNRYAKEVLIYGQDGKLAAKVVYSPEKPLSCGARCWIETQNEVDLL